MAHDEGMTAFVLGVLALVGIVVALSVGGYFLLRWLFVASADRVADEMHRALVQLSNLALGSRAGQASAQAARVMTGRLTNLEAYAAAQGISEAAARAQLARSIERVSRIMDSAIKLPLVGGIGLDSLLGLVPVVGDFSSAGVSVLLIAKSLRYGIPRDLITRMLANVLLDVLVGLIPVLGDLADVWFKANDRNTALLKAYLSEPVHDIVKVRA